MIKKESRQKAREKKHLRIRKRFSGTPERPRLSVFRSNKHIYAQLIDDVAGNTLASASTLDKGIKTVVFDRGGYIYQGKVAALAEAAREAGLEF